MQENKVMLYGMIAVIVLLVITLGLGIYALRDVQQNLAGVKRKLGQVEENYDMLASETQHLVGSGRQADGAMARQLKAYEERERELLQRLTTLGGPSAALPALGTAPSGGGYSYSLIKVTEKRLENGQEILYTRRSNLDEFFAHSRSLQIVATFMYPVWEEQFLLVIHRQLHGGEVFAGPAPVPVSMGMPVPEPASVPAP